MQFLGGKWQKKNEGTSKGNRFSHFAGSFPKKLVSARVWTPDFIALQPGS
jgi:hypothetical protein